MPENDPVILTAPDASVVLDEFNNLVDVLEQAESELALATEQKKLKAADVASCVEALRAKAREMRADARELPLFSDDVHEQ